MINLGRVANNIIALLVLGGFFWLIYQSIKGENKFIGIFGKMKGIIGKGGLK